MSPINLSAFDPSSALLYQKKAVQLFTGSKPDGIFGPDSEASLANWLSENPDGATILCAPDYDWVAVLDGDDIVVRNVVATCFGGAHDDGDDGKTESGVLNNGTNTSLLGVALPIRSIEAATSNSPLAFPGEHIPWLTLVKVWAEDAGEDTAIVCELIDNGPEVRQYPTHAIDLNPNVVLKQFAPTFNPLTVANEWGGSGISYRIIGAAKYAPPCQL